MTVLTFTDTPAQKSLGTPESFGVSDWIRASPKPLAPLAARATVAAAVYKLNPDYAGPCMQVKVGATLYDIGFDASGNLDVAALAAAGGASDVLLMRWYDQSGRGNHLVPVAAGYEPVVMFGGTVVTNPVNGLPAVPTGPGKLLKIAADVLPNNFNVMLLHAYKITALNTAGFYGVCGNFENASPYNGFGVTGSYMGSTHVSLTDAGTNTLFGTPAGSVGANEISVVYRFPAPGTLGRRINRGSTGEFSGVNYFAHDATAFCIGETRAGGSSVSTANELHQLFLAVVFAGAIKSDTEFLDLIASKVNETLHYL